MKRFVCCLCVHVCSGFGNNPYPLSLNDDERCCDECNRTYVIPARLFETSERRLEKDEVIRLRMNIAEAMVDELKR